MEKILGFFKEIGTRLRNPLIFSFVIVWLITNWRIVIGLIFYKSQELQLDGYTSFMDMIDKNRTFTKFWGLPIALSLVYTFVFPIIRNVISAYNAWNFRWGSNWSLKVAKEGGISFNKYIELKTQLQNSIEEVKEIHRKESEIINKNQKLQKKIDDLQFEINKTAESLKASEEVKDGLLMELNNLTEKSDINIFNGTWKIKYKNDDGKVMTERITISNGNISYSNAEAKYETLFNIKKSVYNPRSNEFVLLFERGKEPKLAHFSEIFRPQGQGITFLKNYEENSTILELEKVTG